MGTMTKVDTESLVMGELTRLRKRNEEMEAELRSVLKWAKRMGYIDLQERLSKLLDNGK